MKIAPFGVEIWMNDYETRCRYFLAETCTESSTVDDLLAQEDALLIPGSAMDMEGYLRIGYGAIAGNSSAACPRSALT